MVKKQKPIPPSNLEKSIQATTYWVGTPLSIGIHTVLFIIALIIVLAGVSFNTVLLVVTTLVSLEAIYLSLFIQFTVNQHTKSLQIVAEDIDDIQEDIDDIQEDVEDVGEDIDKIQEEDLEETPEMHDAKTFVAIEEQLGKLSRDMTVLREEIQSLKHRPTDITQG